MIQHFFILMLYLSTCSLQNVVDQNHLKIVKAGDSVNLTCFLTSGTRSSVLWIKQRVGEKPLTIVAAYQALSVQFENDFDQFKRFFVAQDDGSFNLSISNMEESDTATYYCAIYYFTFTFRKGTDLIVKAKQWNVDLQNGSSVYREDSAGALQCSILTESCAGEQNVYWFRHQSGESPPGIIYTQKNFNGQCKRSSETNSTTQTCIYNLPRRNFSHYDAGIYYCAVAMCGKILFGEGRKPDSDKCFQTPWGKTVLVLATTNILSVIVIIILGAQLYKLRQKDGIHNNQLSQLMAEDTDALNYTALSFSQNASSRRPRETKQQDNSVYARVRHQ